MLTSTFDFTAVVQGTARHVATKSKPEVVFQYYKNMAEVDHSDKLVPYLQLACSTSK